MAGLAVKKAIDYFYDKACSQATLIVDLLLEVRCWQIA
jgi:hypothetical protein